jgi:hypothetical protein
MLIYVCLAIKNDPWEQKNISANIPTAQIEKNKKKVIDWKIENYFDIENEDPSNYAVYGWTCGNDKNSSCELTQP